MVFCLGTQAAHDIQPDSADVLGVQKCRHSADDIQYDEMLDEKMQLHHSLL
jgi:hypothetical protein